MQIRPEIDLYLASRSLFSFAIEYKILVGVDRQFTDEEIVNTSADIFLRGIMKDKYIRKENG